ncbi:MAG: glycosyltransferase family 2 protein [Hungatella sp.]|nr:glycosyltransferase family 2 protein [Hungatella sp.]
MKLITISIAAYNIEKYLEKTLNSLIHQELLDKIEVLIIDDGSIDNTSNIAKKFEKKYPNTFRYIAKENGGHGSTINKGMELATGKYFRVLDGDDYFNTENFVKLIRALENTQEDMVITNYLWVDDKGNSQRHNHGVFSILEHGTVYEFDNKFDASLFGLSTISIKTELLKKSNIKIREKCFYVDMEFVIWCIHLSDSFIFYNYDVYMYRCLGTADNSINKDNMIKNVKMQELVALDLIDFYTQQVESQNTSANKKKMILQRIEQSIMATVRTYLLIRGRHEKRKFIIDFDNSIEKKSANIFGDLNQNRFMYLIRICNYKLISIIGVCYKIYLYLKN